MNPVAGSWAPCGAETSGTELLRQGGAAYSLSASGPRPPEAFPLTGQPLGVGTLGAAPELTLVHTAFSEKPSQL